MKTHKRIIIITEQQLREIEDNFSYWDPDDDSNFGDGGSTVKTNGNIENGGDDAEINLTTDGFANDLCPQYRFRATAVRYPHHNMIEGVSIKGNDVNNADDIGEMPSAVKNNKDLNTLVNGKNDNLVRIPQSVQDKVDLALKTIRDNNLTSKQKGIVLNKFIEEINTNSVPYQMQRKWRGNIKNGLVKNGLDRSSATELENEAD